ncbi:MAG: hypothetical protein ACSLE0_22260 [Chitinophagaceae bacterium]
MKQEVQVNILPTKDKSHLQLRTNKSGSIKLIYYKHSLGCISRVNQHLYFTTDEEIKEDDWGIGFAVGIKKQDGTRVGRGHFLFKHDGTSIGKLNAICEGSRKIVATTDKSLKLPCTCLGMQDKVKCNWMCKTHRDYMLPQIPQQFIEEYIKQGGINKVIVEYEKKSYSNRFNSVDETGIKKTWGTDLQIKTDSNNCVIVHLIEEKMYSKKEVEILIKEYALKEHLRSNDSRLLNNWIKENL